MEKKLIITPFFLFFVLNCNVFGLSQPVAGQSNYVVIGAFSIPRNAKEFVEKAKKIDVKAEYAMNSNRHLLYVYVMQTEDKSVAVEKAKRLRSESPYNDTWVYSGYLGDGPVAEGGGHDFNPETGNRITNVTAADAAKKTEPAEQQKVEAPATKIIEDAKTEEPKVESTKIDEVEDGKAFLFQIFSATNQQPINGDVDVIDLDRTRKAATYRGNEGVRVRSVNKSGNIALSCEVFGYRKLQQNINFNDPTASEGVKVKDGKAVVPFELVRLQKGDIAVMYHVYFFKDAAVMRPESRYEVTSLMEMLKENPQYKIRIHGHTNGNSHGKIISIKEGNDQFSLNDTEEGFGSAKKLSEERAKVIESFLLANGIEANRMQVKAWGGKRPLYEKNSNQAQSNVRVEIEILEN